MEFENEFLNVDFHSVPLEPPFQLDQSWYKKTVKRLQGKLSEKGLDGMLLADQWNIRYFTGLDCWVTERPFWVFIPSNGKPSMYYPSLDRDLVKTWWIPDGSWYFDYPHCGSFDVNVYDAGDRVDLFTWLLRNISDLGYEKAKIGIDKEFSSSQKQSADEKYPAMSFIPASDLCLKMRQIKTPEEIDLLTNAVRFQDHLLEYARYLIIHYPGVTDFSIQHEVKRYGTHLLMKYHQLDGGLHHGTGIDLAFTVRAGLPSAYPHPNQFYYHHIKEGDAIQLAGFVHVGGYVGEGYRAVQVNPASDLQKRMWEVHTEMVFTQIENTRPGVRCCDVAEKVLAVAKKNGMDKYLYHRVGHGIGMEGHQAPYITPGDPTVIEEGMVFSNEPGLYNPEGGFGYNHSNALLVTDTGVRILNETPITKEWCFVDFE